MSALPIKPLGHRAYGSIPHLPGSRRGPSDKGLSVEQARILTERVRDKHDFITVQEKLDGSCVAVAKIDGAIIPLIRAGYRAEDSRYTQHHHFANWVNQNRDRFSALLNDGERCVGEWLMEAHGTIYKLKHEPFVIFDIMRDHDRALACEVKARCEFEAFVTPMLIHEGAPVSIECAMQELDDMSGHGAIDGAEGAVWRVERKGSVDFLGKYVRPEKEDGKYLDSVTGGEPVYNWQPP